MAGQRHQRQIAHRDLERARRQPELGGRAADRFQTRAVRRGVTELPNPRQAHLAAEVAADHAKAGRAAIHLVDLLDVFDLADALFSLPEKAVLVREWILALGGFGRGRGLVHADLVVRCDFGRQHLGREIERHARFRFGLVLREPFLHQPAEFRVTAFQVAHRVRFEREEAAIAEGFDRSGARRAVQDREFAKEIAVAIEGEILLRAVVGMESARPSFLENEHRAGRIALPDNGVAFWPLRPASVFPPGCAKRARAGGRNY